MPDDPPVLPDVVPEAPREAFAPAVTDYQMPPPKHGRPPKKERPPPPPPDPRPLAVQVEDRYQELRASDSQIRKLEAEIERQRAEARRVRQFIRLAENGIRTHQGWLKKEAVAYVQKAANVQTIPGFAVRREAPLEFRRRMVARQAELKAQAMLLLKAKTAENP